jgi:hypothetical protein
MSIIPQPAPDTGNALSELPSLLKAWIKLQEEIVTMNAELSQRKKHSKTLKDTILRIMESNKVAALNVSRGVISHRVREKAEPVNTSYLLKQCTTFFEGDETKAKALVEYLETKREIKQQHDLKLTMPKPEGDELSRRS